MLGRRFARDRAAVRCNDLLGDGKAKPGATAIGRTCRVQAIELLKDYLEHSRRNRVTMVNKANSHATVILAPSLNRDGRSFVAIGDGVFHDVVEHASHLVAIHKYRQILAHINLDIFVLLVENGIELIGHLRQ